MCRGGAAPGLARVRLLHLAAGGRPSSNAPFAGLTTRSHEPEPKRGRPTGGLFAPRRALVGDARDKGEARDKGGVTRVGGGVALAYGGVVRAGLLRIDSHRHLERSQNCSGRKDSGKGVISWGLGLKRRA